MPDKNGKNKNYKNIAAEGMIGMKKYIRPVSEIKSNPNFATPGTEFKATKPGTSNQPKTETSGDRAVKSIKKVLGGALTGAAAALTAKSPYMMYDKKPGVMMSESPIMKKCGSKRYGKKK